MTAPPDAIFKANDIRGVFGETLTEDGVQHIGRALASAVVKDGGGTIAVGRDGRKSSPVLAQALSRGLQEGGAQVLDIGLAPTPALYFAAYQQANGCGAMITGSHNPPDHNGIKMLIGGKTLGGKQAQQLPQAKAQVHHDHSACQSLDIRRQYFAAAAKAAGDCHPLRLVVDAGNGAAGEYAPQLYQQLGHEVHPLFCEIDGSFPNHHPDPAQPENLSFAREELKKTRADAAFVFDGDGDRLGVIVPGKEDWVFPDRLLMLLARDMLARNPGGRVVFDVKCSAHLAPWIVKHGGVPDMQPTGHAFIKKQMKETGALLGGEMSGHFYFAENYLGFDDALLAGAKLAKIFAEHKQPLADVPKSFASPEIVIDIGKRNGHEIIDTLARRASFANAKIINIDGVRAEYEDGFGLARASNTTASLVLRFEGETEAALQRIKNDFYQALADVQVQVKE